MLEEKVEMDYSKVNDDNYHGKNRVLGQGGCDFLTCCLATAFPCWVCGSCKTVSSISQFYNDLKFILLSPNKGRTKARNARSTMAETN